MKKVFLVFVLFWLIGVVSWTSQTYAAPNCKSVANNLDICTDNLNQCTADLGTCNGSLGTCNTDLNTCNTNFGTCSADLGTCNGDLTTCNADLSTSQANLTTCNADLATCNADLATCVAESQIFPGDGYGNPDAFGVSGHGPALSYTDNGDGTFTDNNTGFMWEKKDDASGVHDKDNTYRWSATGSLPDGTLFTDFLAKLNNTCDGAGTTSCTTDADCTGLCGLAGHRDWRIPNVKELQSIVNYSTFSPASSVPGLNSASFCWAATTNAFNINSAWLVNPGNGDVFRSGSKGDFTFARAARP